VLQHALDTALAGRSHVTLVSGDSGIGKTSLAEVLAERAEQLGARVVWGRCYEGEGAPAYWPWRQILRAYAETAAPAVLRAAAGADAPMLTRIAPELQTALPESDASQMGPDPDHERFRLFESVTTFLRRGAAHAPLLIVLDDLQWCDRSSLLLVEHLAMQLRDDRIMLLGTYRDEGLDRRQPLARTLGVLARRTALVRLRLEGLSVDHVEQYARLISGQIPPTGLPETIHRQTEGNPFFVREVIQLLLDEDRFTAGAEAPESWFGIPQGVREAIVLRLDRLSDTAYRMLGVAAVIGREFWLDVLADVAGASEAAVLDALDDARAARVLVDSVSAPGGFRFAHALIRQTLYEELSQARRTFTHGRVGAAIERLRASNLEPYLADLAVNFELAIGSIGGEKAIEYSVLAGAQALDRVSYAEAVDHFARALRVLDYTDPAATRRRCAVLLQLGEARKRAGDTAEARATFEAAIELARDLHDDAAFAAAALGIAETGFYSEFWYAGLVELLEEAAALQGDIPTDVRVRVLANLIQALEDRPRSEAHRRALSVQAVELSTRSPSPAIQALARHAHVVSHWSPDNLAERLADTQAVIAGAEAGHDVRLALVGRAWRIYDLLELGDMPGVDAEMEANAAAAQALRQPQYNWTARVRRAMRVTMEGRLAEAEKLAEEAALAGRRSMAGPAAANHFVQLFAIRREQDRLDELREQAQEFADAYPGFPAWQCVLGLQAAELGDIERARGVLREFADAGFETLPRDTYWLANLALLAETAALTRDRRAAEALLPHLAPYAGRVISPGMNAVCLGPADYYLGLLCLCLSRWEEARRYLQDAATLSQRIGMRLLQAYALAAQADVALRQAPVDAERARTLRSAAAELSATLESRRLARHVGGAPAAAHDE
jgi:predicted ATPase